MVGRFYHMLMLRFLANIRFNINNCFSRVGRRLLYRHRPTVRRGFRNSPPGFQTVWSQFLREYTVVASLGDAEARKRAQGIRIHRNKKNEIHIHTQKLYFILIKPPNRLNWNPKQTQISFNIQIMYFFLSWSYIQQHSSQLIAMSRMVSAVVL